MGILDRRRTTRRIARLTDRSRRLRQEIEGLAAEAAQVAGDADTARVDAAVTPAAPLRREARRAAAAHENLQRLLADRRDQLAAVEAERDHLLEAFGAR